MKTPILSLADVEVARRHLAGHVRRTPCHRAPALADILGRNIWLKREDLQRTGAFKERGARNALASLSAEQRARGVTAASAGNHALGLAFHGPVLGVKVTVVMPVEASPVKIARCRGLGAHVLLHGETFDAAQAFACALAAESGATYVHPFDDLTVIAGQGTMALEILEQAPALDALVVPVGGGGLLAGVATVIKALKPSVRIVAVEPENAAGYLAACVRGAPGSLRPGLTVADGLAVARVGALSFALSLPLIDDVVTVNERELAEAIALLARRAGVVAEGAGAAPLAALLADKVRGQAVVLPISGGNIEPARHAAVLAGVPDVPPRARLSRAA